MPRAVKSLKSDSLHATLSRRDQERRTETRRLAFVRTGPTRNDLLPKLHLEDRDPNLLVVPKRNVRRMDASHVREVVHAIEVFGFTSPVLIEAGGAVIDGLVRVEAARLLGLPAIPCIVVDHLGASELRTLRLTVNRLAEKGDWDFEQLKLEIEELVLEDIDLGVTGFSHIEIDQMLVVEPEAVEEGVLAPDLEAKAVARVGDVFRLGRHRLVCGDARDPEVLRVLMGEDLARMVFTDQPYNVPIAGHVTSGSHREFPMASGEMSESEFAAFNAAWIAAALPYLEEGGTLATFIDWRHQLSVTVAAIAAGLAQLNLIVWAKTNAGMGSLYRSQHELLPLFKKGGAAHVNNVELGRGGRSRSNVWTYPGASTIGSDPRRGLKDHPTVKPVAMLVDALFDLTRKDEIVLDPFLGSGSTLMAAEKTGRVCRGVEIDLLYVDVVIRRWEEKTKRPAQLESSGETFAELSVRRAREGDASESGDAAAVDETPISAPVRAGRRTRSSSRGTRP